MSDTNQGSDANAARIAELEAERDALKAQLEEQGDALKASSSEVERQAAELKAFADEVEQLKSDLKAAGQNKPKSAKAAAGKTVSVEVLRGEITVGPGEVLAKGEKGRIPEDDADRLEGLGVVRRA